MLLRKDYGSHYRNDTVLSVFASNGLMALEGVRWQGNRTSDMKRFSRRASSHPCGISHGFLERRVHSVSFPGQTGLEMEAAQYTSVFQY